MEAPFAEILHTCMLYTTVSEANRLSETSSALNRCVDASGDWAAIAFTRCVRYPADPPDPPIRPWRVVCGLHERLWDAWRGTPHLHQVTVCDELRHDGLSNLDVLIVEFLAGEDAIVLGHSHGHLSVWEFRSPRPQDGETALDAFVLGTLQTSGSFDVQDLHVCPSAASEPFALMLGRSVWLAAAVGPAVYIWESAGCARKGRQAAALKDWTPRGALRHAPLFPRAFHTVWAVRLCEANHEWRIALTVGEDGVLRGWRCGHGDTGTLAWQCDVGDARQVIVSPLSPPSQGDGRGLAAVARADHRSLQLLDVDTGEVTDSIHGVWPDVTGSLPISATCSTCANVVLFSSITERGDGALCGIDLRTRLDASRGQPWAVSKKGGPCICTAWDCDARWETSQMEVEPIVGSLAGPGRVLCFALPVPAVQAIVAIISDGTPSKSLEVWESSAVRGLGFGGACFRGKVPSFAGNSQLVAVGGRRIVLLNPRALLEKGKLNVLEWRSRRRSAELAVPSRGTRGIRAHIGQMCACGVLGCYGGVLRSL